MNVSRFVKCAHKSFPPPVLRRNSRYASPNKFTLSAVFMKQRDLHSTFSATWNLLNWIEVHPQIIRLAIYNRLVVVLVKYFEFQTHLTNEFPSTKSIDVISFRFVDEFHLVSLFISSFPHTLRACECEALRASFLHGISECSQWHYSY